jgi:hypothetical protein
MYKELRKGTYIMLQGLVTLQQLANGNTGTALFWRTLFGNPLEVIAVTALAVILVIAFFQLIVELSKYNVIRATIASLLAYILFIAIVTPVFGEDAAKMSAYVMTSYIFFVEAIAKDKDFLNYLTLLGGAIAWIAKTTAEVVKWTLVQAERFWSYSLVVTSLLVRDIISFTGELTRVLWNLFQNRTRRIRTIEFVETSEASDK